MSLLHRLQLQAIRNHLESMVDVGPEHIEQGGFLHPDDDRLPVGNELAVLAEEAAVSSIRVSRPLAISQRPDEDIDLEAVDRRGATAREEIPDDLFV